ncbi:von Willebrand factor A domain-containing protein 3B [Geodia barretti]|uniref:von Willebrand factor A domain-containing protein 3B n=1 Tax=Geodia barretti TaxID=519541 RepID=A0AA35TGP5_GEOBA|nr:von Willebrand factor A domain-containing protein 3B [Geodia barretti]
MEHYLSSQDCLKECGLKASGLALTQILGSLGFKQCAGDVECLGRSVTSQYGVGLFLQHPDPTGQVYNLVDANEQKLGIIELKLTAVIDSLKARLELLRSGRCCADETNKETLSMGIESELEEAKNILAQIQALHMEVEERAKNNCESCVVTNVPENNPQPKKSSKTQPKMPKTKSTIEQRAIAKTVQPHHTPIKNSTSVTISSKTKRKRNQLTPRHKRASHGVTKTFGQSKTSRKPMVGVVKGSTVLARCKSDSFYYRGVVAGGLSKNCADVQFQGGEKQETPLDEMLVVGGACPQPHLRTHDYVLCCVRMPHGHHSSMFGICDLYIPAQVQAVPTETTMCSLFSVTTFNGDHVISSRSGLVRITESRYRAITNQLVKHPIQQPLDPISTTQQAIATQETIIKVGCNSTDGGSETASQVASNEATPCSSYHTTLEKRDRGTSTESVETKEKGIIAQVSTQEQAVCTNPQTVDQSTTTSIGTAREGKSTTTELRLGDETDSAESTEWEAGTQVFCCWPQSSWYSKATVLGRGNSPSRWTVQAETGDVAHIPSSHILLPIDSQVTAEGATVLAPHPMFQGLAPGTIVAVADHSSEPFCVEFYDGLQAFKSEAHQLTPAQHGTAVSLLEERGKCWVGHTVIARRESDGVYYPAVVKEQLGRQCYRVQWAEGTEQTQTILHMFGPPTVRRTLQAGDHVIALAMAGIGACLPGTVTGTGTKQAVEIKFSDGERQTVHKDQCFWISPAYFLSAVEFISASFYDN